MDVTSLAKEFIHNSNGTGPPPGDFAALQSVMDSLNSPDGDALISKITAKLTPKPSRGKK